MNWRPMLRWALVAVAFLSLLLPAVRIAAPPVVAPQSFTGIALVEAGWGAFSASSSDAVRFTATVTPLGFDQLIFHPERLAPGSPPPGAPRIAMLRMSGVFRLARFIPVEVLAEAGFGLLIPLFLLFRLDDWARAFAGLALVCGVFALVLFAWLNSAASDQWSLLASQLPAGTLGPWLGVTPLAALFVPPLAFLVFLILPPGPRA